jgi:hypothetical protein
MDVCGVNPHNQEDGPEFPNALTEEVHSASAECAARFCCSYLGNYDTWRNSNNMLRFLSRQIGADYTNEFEQMFDGRFGRSKRSATPYPQVRVGPARVEVFFSAEDGVAKHYSSAWRSVHFMTFSYTADDIADALSLLRHHKAIHLVTKLSPGSIRRIDCWHKCDSYADQ